MKLIHPFFIFFLTFTKFNAQVVTQFVADNDMTHYVFIGAPDIPTMMGRMMTLQKDEEFAAFSARVGGIRTILHQDMLMSIGAWNFPK